MWAKWCLCMALCGLCKASVAVAQELTGSDTISGKVHRIEDVTVTARRTPNKLSSATPVQTLSGSDLTQLGIQDMGDAVRRFAGANVKDYGGIGGLKTVSIRNMGAAHTAVSYDGIAVSNCQGGQIDIGRFSTDNLASLSLSVGQGDELLQSARLFASAGVLSIQTERPHFEEGHRSACRVRIKGGSFGYITPSIRWWQQMGSRTTLSADATYMRADGNYPFRLTNGKYVTDERRNNSQIYSWQGEANLYHAFRDSSRLEVKGHYFYSKRGLPGPVTLYNPLSNEQLWDENSFVQARYTRSFAGKWTLLGQAKYNHGWNQYRDQGKQYDNGIYQAVHRQDEYYLSASLLYQPVAGLDFSLAQDGVVNKLRSNMPDCPFPTRYSSLTAFNARYRNRFVTLTGMLLYTALFEEVKVGEAPDNFRRLAPSLSVSIQPFAEEALYLRLMYKSTFRTPSFNDLYYYRLGNRSLRPEKADEYNVGITWGRPLLPFMDYFTLTADAYYNDVTDKIVAFPTTYAWRMANYGTVHATGVDVTLATALRLARRYTLSLTGSYTWQKAIDLTDSDSKSYKDQLPYTPKHAGNASLILETPWCNVGYSMVGVSERYCLSQNIPENRIDGYLEHTATVSREFAVSHAQLRLQAEWVNFTNEQYDVIKYYPMPGRSWRVTGTFTF